MSKHTPGPWSIGFDGHGGIRVIGDYGTTVVGYASPGVPDVVQKANACLFAAAPTLLAACKRFIEINSRHGYEFDSNEPAMFAEIVEAIELAQPK